MMGDYHYIVRLGGEMYIENSNGEEYVKITDPETVARVDKFFADQDRREEQFLADIMKVEKQR